MSDRPRGSHPASPGDGSSDYDWLYGTSPGDRRPPADSEPTRVLPTLNRPSPGSRSRPTADDWLRSPGTRVPPGAPSPEGSGRRREPPAASFRRKHSRLGLLRLVLVLWLVFLVVVPAWAWTRVTKVDAEPPGARPGDQPGTTYLLVGSDSRQGLTRAERRRLSTGVAAGRRADTIMLLHTGSGPSLLLSVPRDSLVDVPGQGRTKINAAYAFGGPQLLVKTLENETGLRIDGYVEIGFGGFVDVVDAVGGIQICPRQRMRDPRANLNLKKGCQEVDGTTALGYARSRYVSALGDIDRARRQREVVSAIGAKAASPWSILNPVRYLRLAFGGANAIAVGKNTGPLDTARFAWAMTRVDGKNGLTCSMPIADLAVTWDPERAMRLFRLIRQDRTSAISNNLCGPSGLAG